MLQKSDLFFGYFALNEILLEIGFIEENENYLW